MSALLVAEDLGRSFRTRRGEVHALRGASLRGDAGEMHVVRGPSGGGKTTLLGILGGMLRPSSGRLAIAGTRLDALGEGPRAAFRARHVGFVFQGMHLMPYLDLAHNVALALPAAGSLADAEQRLAALGLGDRLHHRPAQLSAGERQRGAVARALHARPSVVLADEPTGNLDPESSSRVLTMLEEFREDGGLVVLATHADLPDLRPTRSYELCDGELRSPPSGA